MSKHSIIKAGVGIGLMASSLASMAAFQTFAEPMVFYKVNGSTINYVALLPNMTDSAVLMLDLYQSGSVSTWAYGVGGSVNAAAGGNIWSLSFANGVQPASNSIASITAAGTFYNAAGSQTFLRNADGTNSGAYQTGSSWYGGGPSSLQMQFTQVQTISSQVCNAAFNLLVGAEGNLSYATNSFTIAADGFPTANGSVIVRLGLGASSTSVSSINSSDWNPISNFTASYAFATFSAYTVPNAGAVSTFAPSALAKANLCAAIYNNKMGLNAAGNIIGGATGLVRLW